MIKTKNSLTTISTIVASLFFLLPQPSLAFPIYAQQAYENPREAKANRN